MRAKTRDFSSPADGHTHPELALVTRREVVIGSPQAEGELPERSVFCDPLHVTRIEPIDGAKPKRKSRKRKT